MVAGLLSTLLGGFVADRLQKRFSGSYFLVSGIALLLACPMILMVVWADWPLAWLFVFLAVFCLFFNTGPTPARVAQMAGATDGAAFASAAFADPIRVMIRGDVLIPQAKP